MIRKGVEEARAELPRLLEAAERGQSTVITRRGRPVAALVPVEGYAAAIRQEPLTPLAGSGQCLWGRNRRADHSQITRRMEPPAFDDLPEGALLLMDSAPIIYVLEDHPRLASRFRPLFDAHAAGRLRFAVTTITIAEVLTGPFGAGEDALGQRCRAILETWRPIALDGAIAESAARLRASLRLKLADAVQPASALAVNAAALVTHDRDFSRVRVAARPVLTVARNSRRHLIRKNRFYGKLPKSEDAANLPHSGRPPPQGLARSVRRPVALIGDGRKKMVRSL